MFSIGLGPFTNLYAQFYEITLYFIENVMSPLIIIKALYIINIPFSSKFRIQLLSFCIKFVFLKIWSMCIKQV